MQSSIPMRLAGLLLLAPCFAFAFEQPRVLVDCVSIKSDNLRLACFDRLAAASIAESGNKLDLPTDLASTLPPRNANFAANGNKNPVFSLARHWELDSEHKLGTFSFRPHYSNYILFANHTSSPNQAPSSPTLGMTKRGIDLNDTEVKFQLSFKMKLMEEVAATDADIWFGYTQESNWQLYNRKASSPFRESDYQPELMLVMPVDFNFLGMRARFINTGLVHQSNGLAAPLSRSWNRVYAQLGMEKDNFALSGRVWKRLQESRSNDDNPDIVDYMGHGELAGVYRRDGHIFSMLARRNFASGRGAVQAGWAFPLAENVKGYMLAFSGYGQSMIDYNHYQTTIGLGLWFGY